MISVSDIHSVSLNSRALTSSTHLSWTHSVVLLNEGASFGRDGDTDIQFVRLLVCDCHISNTFVRGAVQLLMEFKAFHTANSPLILLAYS